jgi:hypothetical protein
VGETAYDRIGRGYSEFRRAHAYLDRGARDSISVFHHLDVGFRLVVAELQ